MRDEHIPDSPASPLRIEIELIDVGLIKGHHAHDGVVCDGNPCFESADVHTVDPRPDLVVVTEGDSYRMREARTKQGGAAKKR